MFSCTQKSSKMLTIITIYTLSITLSHYGTSATNETHPSSVPPPLQVTDNICKYGGSGTLKMICRQADAAYFKVKRPIFHSTIEILECIDCNLETLEMKFLNSDNSLTTVDLSNARIVTIASRAFKGLWKMSSLDLSHNNITHLPAGAFENIIRLNKLHLSWNQIETIDVGAFGNLPHLNTLSLQGNRLANPSPTIFQGLTALTTLDVNGNQLVHLEFAQYISKLSYLNANNNSIEALQPNKLGNMSEIEHLFLGNNKISELVKRTFAGAPKLQRLDLSYNQIATMSEFSFGNLLALKTLNLEGNLIPKIGKFVFSDLNNVQELNLHGNGLLDLQTGRLSGMVALQTLNVSGNQLGEFTFTGRKLFLSMHRLDLRSNKLTGIDYRKLLNCMPHLNALHLEENPWSCDIVEDIMQAVRLDNVVVTKSYDVGDLKVCPIDVPWNEYHFVILYTIVGLMLLIFILLVLIVYCKLSRRIANYFMVDYDLKIDAGSTRDNDCHRILNDYDYVRFVKKDDSKSDDLEKY